MAPILSVFTAIGHAAGVGTAATAGAAATGVGAATAVGAGITAAAGAGVYKSVSSARSQAKGYQQSAQDIIKQNAAANQSLKDAQSSAAATASKAVEARRRTQTQTTFTNPLGIQTEAQVARKTLLGQ